MLGLLQKHSIKERVIPIAATIRDVAALAGVSASTVSRTCRNSSSISEKTREKVRRAMEQLGYEPPVYASMNPESAPGNLGIILPPSTYSSFENPFFLEVLHGVSQYCNQKKTLTSLITGKDDREILDVIQVHARNRTISAYIVLFSRVDDPIVDFLYNEGIEYVQIGQPVSHPNDTVAVDNDNLAAGQDAARYLYELGHRRIAFLGSGPRHWYSTARRNGIRLFLQDQGLELPAQRVAEVDYNDPDALEDLRTMLRLPEEERPTAIIAVDEMHALMVRQAAAETGLRIPEDLSLLAFNNSIMSLMTAPTLTSIDVNALQLGIEAALQAIKHLETPDLMASRTLVPYRIIERDSCRKIGSEQSPAK